MKQTNYRGYSLSRAQVWGFGTVWRIFDKCGVKVGTAEFKSEARRKIDLAILAKVIP